MKLLSLAAFCGALAFGTQGGAEADDDAAVLQDHKIAYVTTSLHWSNYQTAELRKDCPKGMNGWGPRETFKALYPKGGSVADTELAREALKLFPQDQKAKFPYILRQGPIAIGLNLDGKVGKKDFTSPEGEKGIDNNLFRVIGCNAEYRAPEGQLQLFANKQHQTNYYGRTLIELTNVDNLKNADNVEVTIYRGRDPLLLDASGENFAPGATERLDMRYGQSFIQHLRGKIVDGVLTTDPIKEGVWPWAIYSDAESDLDIHDMRFRLKLTPNNADGLLAGYADVESYYHWLTALSTHHLAYGQLDPSEFYWALHDNADAYPDKNGHNTAISSSLSITMAQVYIVHPDDKVAGMEAGR